MAERILDNGVTKHAFSHDLNAQPFWSTGVTIPTGAGFPKGAVFIKTDVADGTGPFYVNQGSNTVADFTLVTQAV